MFCFHPWKTSCLGITSGKESIYRPTWISLLTLSKVGGRTRLGLFPNKSIQKKVDVYFFIYLTCTWRLLFMCHRPTPKIWNDRTQMFRKQRRAGLNERWSIYRTRRSISELRGKRSKRGALISENNGYFGIFLVWFKGHACFFF